MRQLRLKIDATIGAAHRRYLRKHLIAAHSILNSSLMHLSLALVNDAKMSQLHFQFLGISGPTDVLTFELDENVAGNIISGEVIICVPEARRQAQLRGSQVEQELLLYALHGMLHLSGFDDKTEAGYRKMHRKEDEILTKLGVGPVFAGKSRRRSPPGPKDQ